MWQLFLSQQCCQVSKTGGGGEGLNNSTREFQHFLSYGQKTKPSKWEIVGSCSPHPNHCNLTWDPLAPWHPDSLVSLSIQPTSAFTCQAYFLLLMYINDILDFTYQWTSCTDKLPKYDNESSIWNQIHSFCNQLEYIMKRYSLLIFTLFPVNHK